MEPGFRPLSKMHGRHRLRDPVRDSGDGGFILRLLQP